MGTKTIDTMDFWVETRRSDIEGGKCCLVSKCMEKVAIERTLREFDPKGGDHKVRIDGGAVRFNFQGFKWQAVTPKAAKRALIRYDKERARRAKAEAAGLPFKSAVEPHSYRLEAHKIGKIRPLTRERQEQINAARRKRVAEGRPDNSTYDLRYRVQGLGTV